MQILANFLKGLALLLLYALPLITSPQQSDWTWQNPLPQGNYLWDLQVIDENTLFTTGQGGTIMKSIDGGANWTTFNTGNTKLLRCAKFMQNGMKGYAAGANATLIKTNDGGLNWQNLTINQDVDLYAMDFPDEQTGFVAGNPGYIIYKTSDGGSSWTPSDSLPSAVISVIEFPFDNLTGFAGGWMGDSVIYKTIDGGITWVQKPIPFQSAFNDIKTFCFVNEQTGYAAGNRTILKTTDFGESWFSVYSGNGSFKSICFPENETTGYVVGDFNTIFKTSDGGSGWQPINPGVSGSPFYMSVDFVDNQSGFIVGSDGIILKTIDGGLNWTNIRTAITLNGLHAIDFPVNAQTGYIGKYGILKTTNGGNTWMQQDVDITVNKIRFLDNETGYIVGADGAIFKTMNGGLNWDYVFSGIDQYLYDVEFPVNSMTGYVSGESGKLAKTTDGGSTWTPIGSFNKDIRAMCFPTDNLIGYVTTDYQRIYKTIDGGATWEIKYDGNIPGATMSDILFPFDAQTGYALSYGNGSKVLRTMDGGDNWQVFDTGISQDLLSISFPSPEVGYIAAFHDNFSSVLLKTTDSGLTWNKVPVPYAYALTAVCFPVDANTGYVVGELSGAILKTITGGGILSSAHDFPVGNPNQHNTLISNYPNPFTGATTIAWQLPEKSLVILKVYDFTGRELKTLVNCEMARGEHQVAFNSEGLPAGVYFYQLQSNKGIATNKMMIIE
ncbi:MAG: T9SS type A sorting domain-containing protein [Lentimicrobium sp.]|nr:T9SS type A sorting domain-containing protein [Lentimicrobium sp.]